MTDLSQLSPAKPPGGLSSFANLLQMLLGFDETEEDFSYASYLSCLGLMPGSAPKETHPFHFPLGFPAEGPMAILPDPCAEQMEAAFADLREIRDQLLSTRNETGEVSIEICDELGPRAMAAVRRLGSALQYRHWDSGETLVKMLQINEAFSSLGINDAELVQASRDHIGCFVREDMDESDNKAPVSPIRLVFRLSKAETVSEATPSKLNELRNRSERFAAVHNALFPSEHCIVEFRDHSAATLIKSEPIGPSYAEVIAVQEAFRASVRAEQEDA